ncbi:putative oxidoreductase C2F3.05c [Zalerion maritima]|uniref:Oxidoreductase C2F3.05c n=1 Tax=Zalerion maritima TaxID=339359 RepID=A0AAD5RRE9_9PEZI|nr:putative oxidoreductase C2F3.05c [Zalerion maritima]
MATSPPASPLPPRPMSAMVRSAPRSSSRLSMSSRAGAGGGGSRASDEDARTAVKVAVRVRPPLKPTDPGFELIPQRFQRSMVQCNTPTSLAIDSPQGRKLFVFDRVFPEDTEQAGIWEYLHDSVNAFLQGYNVSLLAYGQSGAGKSYTMGTSGPLDQDNLEAMGVIPRAATALFEKLDGSSGTSTKLPNPNRGSMSHLRSPAKYSQANNLNKDKPWVLKATYVEIYNESLRDLLIPDHTPAHERGSVTIREDVKGNILLTGLRQVEISSVDDLMNALNFGSTIRQTDSTAINAKSSRSHAVFSLNLIQRKNKLQTTQGNDKRFSMPIEAMTGAETMVTTDSKFHFVDLAGSERLKNTGAQGERAKEGISINAGLAALGKVISQLSSRSPGAHVSYRDSKLTRLLQDSLGGNAITYMIACVTPAEFHLSETLNTVQYAQRARAIQSKPRIQAVEEGDKQGQIERLKAEVAFLREQIQQLRNGSGVEGRNPQPSERSERSNGKEVELQNQLLDAQENYSALSQRHARLIAEMAKARDNELAENQQHEDSLGDSATERLNRSNSFAQAVEQVVLEYEKTIQSLEQSLSNTRGSLSSTETFLLEKETKCAYMDTVNAQLQARLQKMVDREASTENYLHDLENKLDGHTSGEEKNAAIVIELRKEIARVRENEAGCEDYISTLEERLAEADQDAELMQREIDRLEQVIERQRSLGKLDSLLYELDHIQQDTKQETDQPDLANGNGVVTRREAIEQRSRSQSHVRSIHTHRDTIPEVGEENEEDEMSTEKARDAARSALEGNARPESPEEADAKANAEDFSPQSPAQSKFVADKLEDVTQELVDLRVEHESTVNEFDLLHAKYEEALRTLAELQDVVDESKHPQRPRDSMLSVSSPTGTRPSSFLSDPSHGAQYSSRSLSSELSSAMGSPVTADTSTSDAETITVKPVVAIDGVINGDASSEEVDSKALTAELERLKAIAAEKQSAEHELTEKYAELETKHQETLDMVEELKTEVSKAKMAEATSPKSATPVIRRKSSQNVMIIDRAHRSFASLRNIATDNFEDQPDVMQNFELNLNAAMHELHARSERIQELEAGVTTAKKEMEAKMAIISGLTRERSSLKASPVDISVVSTLKYQLEKNEKQLKQLQETHESREKELLSELDKLRASLKATPAAPAPAPSSPVSALVKPSSNETDRAIVSDDATAEYEAQAAETQNRVTELEKELSSWESRHQSALESMQAAEAEMKKTIGGLEAQVASSNQKLEDMSENENFKQEESKELHTKHRNLVNFLRSEIDEYKAIINSNASKVGELERAHAEAQETLEDAVRERDSVAAESGTHKVLVAKLQTQILDHEQSIKIFEEKTRVMEADHAHQLEEMRASYKEEYEEQLANLICENTEKMNILEADLNEARDDLTKVATQVAFALGMDVSVEKITERIDDLIADQKALSQEQAKTAKLEQQMDEVTRLNDHVVRELESVKSSLAEIVTPEGEAMRSPQNTSDHLSLLRQKMVELESRNKKNSRIVEELEEQLNSNYEQAQITNNRLSTLTERNAQLEGATHTKASLMSELDTIKEEYAALQAKYDEILPAVDGNGPKRSNSTNSNLRKSNSVASLPSPPPSVPLPPLPGGALGNVPSTPTGVRPPSKDLAISQIQEDQEARIKSIEKHLIAEKQLTLTLEEALTDLEKQSNKVKTDADAWKRKCMDLEQENKNLEQENKNLKDKPQHDQRWSVQAVEEERKKRMDAELARARMEERMNALNVAKKKKKGSLNCF